MVEKLEVIIASIHRLSIPELKALAITTDSSLKKYLVLKCLYEEHDEVNFVHEWFLNSKISAASVMLSWIIKDTGVLQQFVKKTNDAKSTAHLMFLFSNPILKYYEIQGKEFCNEFVYIVDCVNSEEMLFQALLEGHVEDSDYNPCAVSIIQKITDLSLLLSLKLLLPTQYQRFLSLRISTLKKENLSE